MNQTYDELVMQVIGLTVSYMIASTMDYVDSNKAEREEPIRKSLEDTLHHITRLENGSLIKTLQRRARKASGQHMITNVRINVKIGDKRDAYVHGRTDYKADDEIID